MRLRGRETSLRGRQPFGRQRHLRPPLRQLFADERQREREFGVAVRLLAFPFRELRDGQIIGGDIMDASQISSAWKNSSNQSIQHQFPEQMAQRSVINRAIKPFIEGGEIRTDYGEAFVSAVTETSANEYDDPDDACQPQQEKDDGFGRRFNLGGLGRPMKARTEEAPKEDPA